MSLHPSPFEQLFDLEPGSTEPLAPLKTSTSLIDPSTSEILEMVPEPTVEELDKEARLEDMIIVKQLDTIHARSMQAFEQQQAMSQEVDPKFSARNSEVAAQFLNIALSAVNSRSEAKYKRQKMMLAAGSIGKPTQVQNNLIVADRNTLLRDLFKQDYEKTMGEQIKDELNPNKD
jgi:hypothetical protein